MSDLISRSALIKEIRGWQEDIYDNEYDADKFDFVFERIYEILEELPTVEAKPVEWIPCSERMPEIGEMVMVTQKVYGENMVCICSYEFADGYGCGFYGSSGDVIAWMPLPAPYNADMRGEKNGV